MKKLFYIICALIFVSCANNRSPKKEVSSLKFVVPTPPTLLSDVEERLEYVTLHYWDNYFSNTSAPTDSAYMLGIKDGEVEQAFSNYLTLVFSLPMDKGQVRIRSLFSKLEKTQNSLLYVKFSDMVVKYLYDPNSPYRSEDLYLPFVEGLAKSDYTENNKRKGYEFELEMCLMNPYGAVAPDFEFKDIRDRRYTLHTVKANYILLFFSNPGCHACLDIINQLGTRPYLEAMIKDKFLSIINIYIDDEMDKWKEYVSTYPDYWLNCYDSQKVIKDDLYYVRAIPSLYLLDKDKRILLKDAPVERVLDFFDNFINKN